MMNDKEWRMQLEAARERLAAIFREVCVAHIETSILYALHRAEIDWAYTCRSMLDKLDVAYEQLLADPQAEAGPSSVVFRVLAAEVRGEVWHTGLEEARSEREAARQVTNGVNLEFLVRMWLQWRLQAPPDAP